MALLKKLLLLLLVFLCDQVLGKKFLGFFPHPGKSEHHVIAPILYELAKRGHRVVYLTPVLPPFSHPNLEIRYMEPYKGKPSGGLYEYGQKPTFVQAHILGSMTEAASENFYGNPAAQEIIHDNETYDGVLMESFFYQEPVSALIHKYNCPGIDIMSLGDSAWGNELAGFTPNPAYQIDYHTVRTERLDFWDRIYNFYVCWTTVLVSYYHLWRKQTVMDKYFNYTGWENRPPLHRLISNRSLVLLNRDIVMDYPYPQPPHVKEVGGVNILPSEPLPQGLQETMDKSKQGVIYFSLGTHVGSADFLQSAQGKAFLSAFKGIPQTVITKFETDNDTEVPANVIRLKWVPQQGILGHKNCKLFITHGGLLSLTEAVYNGIPVIGIPFFGDQPKNMEHVEHYGYGLKLTYNNISEGSVKWAIQEVLSNKKYYEVVQERSKILRDKRNKRVEEAVYWIEYAIKYPNFLTPRGAYLTFFQLHNIDINVFIISSFFIVFIILKNVFLCFKNTFSKKYKRKVD